MKTISKYIFVFFLFSLSISVLAENVNEIKITGNKKISEETIIIYGEIKKNKDYLEKDINKVINNLYSTGLFEDINIVLEKNTLLINVREYKSISSLIISGEKSNNFLDKLKKNLRLKEKRPFNRSFLNQDIETIKRFYSSRGFNSVNAEITVNDLDDNNVELIIDIAKGNKTKISSIKFLGDKKIKDKRLRDIIASEEDKFWKVLSSNTNFSESQINLDTRLLENYYRSIGYKNVKVISKSANFNDEGNIDLVYSISAGKRFKINKIETNVDDIYDKKIFLPLNKEYTSVIGQFYSPFTIRKLLESIDELIENNNLQFVEHNVQESIDEETNNISIKFNIFEGKKILVEKVNIYGNNVTSEKVIRSELLVDEGDPFTLIGVQKSISNIKARNIFRDVNYELTDGTDENLKIINLTVEEKPTGEISAGAGIGTDGGSFAFNISENNWLGEGKILNFELEVDQEAIEGTFNYSDPNYDFLGNAINYYLGSASNDKPNQGYENTVISSGINTTFEQYKNIYTNLGLGFSYDDLRTDGTASANLKKQSGEFSEINANYGLKYDRRNRSFMPTDGSIIQFSQILPIYADRPYIGNTFSASKYNEFTENIIGAGKIYLSSINGLDDEDVRISKRKFLSSSRLRGFKRNKVGPKDGTDHIGGNYAAAVNFETTLPNFLPDNTRTDIGLFLDFGNVWSVDYDKTIDDSNKLRSSTGVALNWSSPLGPMSFVFSTNLQKAETDETESFKFNLGTTF